MDDLVPVRRNTKVGRFQPRVPQKSKPSSNSNQPTPNKISKPDTPITSRIQRHNDPLDTPTSASNAPTSSQSTQPISTPLLSPPTVTSTPPLLTASTSGLPLANHSQKRLVEHEDLEPQKKPRLNGPPPLKPTPIPISSLLLSTGCVPAPSTPIHQLQSEGSSEFSTGSLQPPRLNVAPSRSRVPLAQVTEERGRRVVPTEMSVQHMRISDIIEDKFVFGRMSKTEIARLEKVRLRGLHSPPSRPNADHHRNKLNPKSKNNNEGPKNEFVANQRRGPQLVMVNGKMIVDQTSLFIEQNDTQDLRHEVVDETSTKGITSASFRKNPKSTPLKWSQQETGLFYECLSWFGTDFGMIATMFPGRSRPQIKAKFNAEEKGNLQKVNNALMNKKTPSEAIIKTMHELTTARVSERNAKSQPLDVV